MSYHGKVVWITGASSGIGAALAVELASKGATLVLSARRMDKLVAVRDRCERASEHLVLPLDVALASTHQDAFEAVIRRFGKIDSIVLNAGIGQRAAVLETTFEVEKHLMEVNFFGCTSLSRVVLPHFLERNEGHIVVISSIMAFVATPRRATYSASKHALKGYFEALRAELHGTGVTISMIYPGYVHTDISHFALTGPGTPFGSMDEQHKNAMPAATFARKAVRGMMRSKPEMFIGGFERFAPWLARFSPALLRFLLPRLITRK